MRVFQWPEPLCCASTLGPWSFGSPPMFHGTSTGWVDPKILAPLRKIRAGVAKVTLCFTKDFAQLFLLSR